MTNNPNTFQNKQPNKCGQVALDWLGVRMAMGKLFLNLTELTHTRQRPGCEWLSKFLYQTIIDVVKEDVVPDL